MTDNSAYPEDKNEMSDKGPVKYGDVHCVSSDPGKFDFGFLKSDSAETPTPKSTQPSGSYPVAGGSESAFATPTHAPGTLIPDAKVKGYK